MAKLDIPDEYRRCFEDYGESIVRAVLLDGNANTFGLPDNIRTAAISRSKAREYAIAWLSWKQLPWWKRIFT